jgi:competence protein ComFC
VFKENQGCEPICLWCLKDLHHDATIFSVFDDQQVLCLTCQKKLNYKKVEFQIDGIDVVSYVEYDEHISQLLILYKEYFDEALAPVFFRKIKKKIEMDFKGFVCVPLPSSTEKVAQRGFHHLHRMIDSLNIEMKDVLQKTKNVKQARLSKEERTKIDTVFEIKKDMVHTFENLVLIDDVCTTGASLKAAISLLLPHCKNLRAITFSYHPLWKIDKGR